MDVLDGDLLFTVIMVFIWLEFLWELYLSIRQFKVASKESEMPAVLEKVMKVETFEKARQYSLARLRFGFVKDTLSILLSSVALYFQLLAYFWKLADKWDPYKSEVSTSCIWLLCISTIQTIVDLPLSIYNTFVLEEKFGFNKQTFKFFVWDKLKMFLVSQSLSLAVSAIIIVVIKNGGDYFFIYLWIVVCILMLILLTIYPAVIAPLFDKYSRLPDGNLRTKIEEMAAKLKFPLTELYIVEGSKRSSHSNAYFYGLFKSKRIVLFDTLLLKEKQTENNDNDKESQNRKNNEEEQEKEDCGREGCTDEEVLAVLGHELGHWALSHFIKNLIVMQLNLLLLFSVFSFMFKFPPLYHAVGFNGIHQPVLVGLYVVMVYVLMPYNTVLSFLMTCMSRKFEFQADQFAVDLGKGKCLELALLQLYKDNLTFPIYDNLYSTWHHSHPPLLERISAIREAEAKQK